MDIGSQISCGIGVGGSILQGPPPSPSPSPASEGFPADAREREQGHYVAYEALHPPSVLKHINIYINLLKILNYCFYIKTGQLRRI